MLQTLPAGPRFKLVVSPIGNRGFLTVPPEGGPRPMAHSPLLARFVRKVLSLILM